MKAQSEAIIVAGVLSYGERLGLAHAVTAGDSGFYYDGTSNNAGDTIGTTEDAVESGRPWFSRQIDPLVVALDGDDVTSADEALKLAARMQADGLRPVVLGSGGEVGRAHLFVRVPDDQARARWVEAGKAAGFDSRDAIRPPGTPHRSGAEPVLLTPCSWRAALDALLPAPESVVAEAQARTQCRDRSTNHVSRPWVKDDLWRHVTSGPNSAELENPDHRNWLKPGGRLDRSVFDQSVIVRLLLAGWSRDQVLDEFERSTNFVGRKMREKSDHAARRWFDRSWAEANRYVTEDLRSGPDRRDIDNEAAIQVLELVRSGWIDTDPTTTAVAVALAEVSVARGQIRRFPVGAADVATEAGMTTKTARAALGRLQRCGVIERVWRSRGGSHAHRWSWSSDIVRAAVDRGCLTFTSHEHTPCVRAEGKDETPDRGVSIRTIFDVGHDVWRPRALGRATRVTASVIAEHPGVTRSELVKLAGGTKPTIYRHIARLIDYGAVEDHDGALTLVLTEQMADQIAVDSGTAGRRGRARQEFAQMRADRAAAEQDQPRVTLPDADPKTGEVLQPKPKTPAEQWRDQQRDWSDRVRVSPDGVREFRASTAEPDEYTRSVA